MDKVIEESEVILISHKDQSYIDLPAKYPNKYFIELTRNNHSDKYPNIEGINW